MAKILTLPPALAAKIAAGEVIERPAYVVKELIENALDAGAREIYVEIEKEGGERIVVTDNGEGMGCDDLVVCWQRYSTSKTKVDSDLSKIETLGFRGEALASVAAVSNLTIQSRVRDEDVGYKLEVNEGRYIGIEPVGMANGTKVIVEQLFANVPARQKFVLGRQNEWRQIVELVEEYMLAYPAIRWKLTHNGRVVLEEMGQTREERMSAVLGEELMGQIFEVKILRDNFEIVGYLGNPQISFERSWPVYLFVNGRAIKSRKLMQKIKGAYRSLLKVETTPFFVLDIKVPFERVDVNIHPRKEEIRLWDEQEISEAIEGQIKERAKSEDLSFRWKRPRADTESSIAKKVKWGVVGKMRKMGKGEQLMQVKDTYIVWEVEQGVVIVDQHAASERVMYERLIREYEEIGKGKKMKELKEPVRITMPRSKILVVEESLEKFEERGMVLEVVDDGVVVKSVSEELVERNVGQLIGELIEDVITGEETKVDKHSDRMLTFLACRMAVKAGDKLSQGQMREVFESLARTELPYTCPHGRPTHVVISGAQLAQMFGR